MSKYPGRIVTDLAPAGYSVFFDGTGDWITTPSNAWTSLAGQFTLEFWVFFNATPSASAFIGVVSSGGFNIYNDGTRITPNVFGSGNIFNSTLLLTDLGVGRWNHIAVTRNSSNLMTIWLNGTDKGSTTTSASYTAGTWQIGNTNFNCYISNFRATNTCLYTAAFNPPTQLFNITGTSLLTCNSPAIIDQSSNAFAITVNGNSAVSTLTPFTAYVPYNPALGASTPGVWTLDEALQAKGTRQWNMYDPYFNLTTLLLHGNGANNAQNNTFLDSSSNNFSITRNGNTTQGSYSPFSQTGWSYFGSATTDKLTASSTSPANFGSSAFTVEAWVYFNDIGTTRVVASNYQSSTVGWTIYRNTSNFVTFHGSGDGADITSTTAVAVGRWYHIAVSGTPTSPGIRLFINGVQEGSTYTGAVSLDSTNAVVVGDGAGGAGGAGINGYISNLRLLKGTALYTTNFTPPTTPLTNITNTSLLTCQSNRFVDNGTANSGSGYTFTVGGTPSIQPFSPFYPTAAYTPATVGGSGYFDGSGDYLETPNDATLALGSSDFSVEWWEYRTTLAAEDTAIGASGTYGFYFNYYDAGFPRFFLSTSSGSWNVFNNAPTGAISANTWNHFVVTRSGTDFRVFLNGVLSIYATGSGSVVQPNNSFYISGNAAQSHFPGYISSVRVVKGSIPTSYQTSSTTTNTSIFTPPTAPVTTTSQGATANDVELLLNFTNAGIVDSTAKNVLETLGNAQISTAVSKFGGSSISLDGVGDYLRIPSSPLTNLGSGSWTIEMWLYRNGSGTDILYDQRNAATQVAISWYYDGSNILRLLVNGTNVISAASALPLTTWTHIALCKASGSTRMFIDGTQAGSTYTDANTYLNNPVFIGVAFDTTSGANAYIDDLRVTRGIARYIANFTPQTSQWQDE